MTQHTRTLLYTGLLVLVSVCILYSTLNGTSLSAQSVALGATAVDPNCDPFEPWMERRLESVVMRDGAGLSGVIVTNVCGDFITLESTAGGRVFMIHRDHIIYIEGRPL